jgi:hypothetical protein
MTRPRIRARPCRNPGAGAEIGHRRDRHGHRGKDGRRSGADRGADDSHRDHRGHYRHPPENALRLRNYAARGFAAGLTSHGIGTARAFQVDPLAGTFAGIALGLNGLLTALLVPLLLPWLLN